MPDTALTTRVTEETYRRLKLESAIQRRTIQEIVESALRAYLAGADIAAEDLRLRQTGEYTDA